MKQHHTGVSSSPSREAAAFEPDDRVVLPVAVTSSSTGNVQRKIFLHRASYGNNQRPRPPPVQSSAQIQRVCDEAKSVVAYKLAMLSLVKVW